MILRIAVFYMVFAVALGSAVAAPKPEFVVRVLNITTNVTGQNVSASERVLAFILNSPQKALPNAMAEVYLPESLNLGKKVNLAIDPPTKGTAPDSLPVDPESLKMNIYWGSSESVKSGQPKVLTWKDFPQDAKNALKSSGDVAKGSVAKWTADSSKLTQSTSLVGEYRLMSFAGASRMVLEPMQGFPSPVEVTVNIDAKGGTPVQLSWKPVPGAVAYFATAHGIRQDGTIAGWTSGQNPDAAKQACTDSYLNSKQLASLIKKSILLPPEVTQCMIPAGVFDGVDAFMITVTAYGPDSEFKDSEIVAHAVVRSVGSVVRTVTK